MNKSVTRIVAVFLIIVCMATLLPTVQAADTVTIDHEYSKYIGKTWFNWYTQYAGYPADMVFSTGEYWTETMAYFTTTDGRIAFCLEPSVSGTTGSFTNIGWSGIVDFKKRGIALALAYGAPNNGKSSEADLMATAAVVWDMACGYRDRSGAFMLDGDHGTYITSSPFGTALQTNFPAAYAEYTNILAKLAKHGTVPSFSVKLKSQLTDANPIVLKYDAASGTYKASVTDSNGVLESFNFTSTISGLTFAKSGNTLNITATKAAAAQLTTPATIQNRGNEIEVSEDLCTVWYPSGGGQKVCTLDAPTDPVPCYFKLEAEATTGKLQIKKTAPNGGSVAGWSFTIQDAAGKTVGTYVSNASGVITADLAPGTYTVTETDGEYEYWQNDPEPTKTVTVVAGQTATVTFENRLMGKIKILKTVVGEGSVEGWQFRITRLSDNKDMGTFTSGADGTILTGKLEPGSYRVEELLPDGSLYQCTTENPQTVTVTARQTATVTFSNSLRPGKIAIEKVDAQGNPLAGAKFLLEWSKDGGTWAAVTGTPAGEVVTGGCASAGLSDGCLTSGSDGLVVFEGLHPGLYYRLTEVEAPAGYTLLTDTAFEGQLPLDTLTVTLKVVNSPRIVMPMTGAFGPILAAVGAAVTIVCACCLLSRRRRNKK